MLYMYERWPVMLGFGATRGRFACMRGGPSCLGASAGGCVSRRVVAVSAARDGGCAREDGAAGLPRGWPQAEAWAGGLPKGRARKLAEQ